MQGINKDVHVLAKDYQDIVYVQQTFKRLSGNPMVNMHFYMPEGRQARESKALLKESCQLESANQERGLAESEMSVLMLDDSSAYLVQMIEKVKELQRSRSRDKIKQGSRKILIEVGHSANCLYGREDTSRLVDQLLVVMVRGDVPV